MRKLATVVVGCCLFTTILAAQKTPDWLVPTYELYSWKGADGAWNFCVLYTTDRQKSRGEVFDERLALHGLNAVKQKINRLPRSSRIVWFDRLSLGGNRIKGTEALEYPPKEIIKEVRRYAALRKIQVSVFAP